MLSHEPAEALYTFTMESVANARPFVPLVLHEQAS